MMWLVVGSWAQSGGDEALAVGARRKKFNSVRYSHAMTRPGATRTRPPQRHTGHAHAARRSTLEPSLTMAVHFAPKYVRVERVPGTLPVKRHRGEPVLYRVPGNFEREPVPDREHAPDGAC